VLYRFKINFHLILIIATFGCAAQSNLPTNPKSILTSKDWKLEVYDDHVYKLVFTDTNLIMYSNGELIGDDKYYVVEKLNQCGLGKFIESNVGVLSTGKYIVCDGFCLELISVTYNRIEFKNLKTNSDMAAIPL